MGGSIMACVCASYICRRQNKLDSALVRKMKMWLLMMGHDSGLTMGEVGAQWQGQEAAGCVQHYSCNPWYT
jgi:hypothetical protein